MPKKTFELAEEANAKLITQLKNNQPILKKQIEHGCNIQKPTEIFEEPIDKKHGRIEKRKYEVFSPNPMLNKWKEDWPYIRQVIKVTRYREVLGLNSKRTIQSSYYVSNTSLSAKSYAKAIRGHWAIENKLHYVKDKVFMEDKYVKRINPYIFSYLINFCLNIIKIKKAKNIK